MSVNCTVYFLFYSKVHIGEESVVVQLFDSQLIFSFHFDKYIVKRNVKLLYNLKEPC